MTYKDGPRTEKDKRLMYFPIIINNKNPIINCIILLSLFLYFSIIYYSRIKYYEMMYLEIRYSGGGICEVWRVIFRACPWNCLAKPVSGPLCIIIKDWCVNSRLRYMYSEFGQTRTITSFSSFVDYTISILVLKFKATFFSHSIHIYTIMCWKSCYLFTVVA